MSTSLPTRASQLYSNTRAKKPGETIEIVKLDTEVASIVPGEVKKKPGMMEMESKVAEKAKLVAPETAPSRSKPALHSGFDDQLLTKLPPGYSSPSTVTGLTSRSVWRAIVDRLALKKPK